MRNNYYVEFPRPLCRYERAYFETLGSASIFAEAISRHPSVVGQSVPVLSSETGEVLTSYLNGDLDE